MLSRIFSATIFGLQPHKIEVEIDARRGVPGLILIGLPNKAVNEAKERVISALVSCGVRIRNKRTVINLAPADLPKTSSTLELAMAVGLLRLYGLIKQPTDKTLFLGELSLDGSLKAIHGALPLVLSARKMGFEKVVFPLANLHEVETISGIKLCPISHMRKYLDFGRGEKELVVSEPKKFSTENMQSNHGVGKVSSEQKNTFEIDFIHILGQNQAKRALEIAAAGHHNVLLVGPPGMGKSMLAKALVTILPPLTEQESLEVSAIYSVSGQKLKSLITSQPFRNPHHTISRVGLIGGGSLAQPGEISLAHRGILFLDEVTEFGKSTLESLRQPLEEGKITIKRAMGEVEYPASFTLIAATNPCKCGFYKSSLKECICSPAEIRHYKKKLSGPILDRIDLHLRVREVKIDELSHYKTSFDGESSQKILQRVLFARKKQRQRFDKGKDVTNGEMTVDMIKKFCKIEKIAKNILDQAGEKLKLSARGYFKVIKVAQTIADLDNSEEILQKHVLEALGYRN